jgi:IS30 family transposase
VSNGYRVALDRSKSASCRSSRCATDSWTFVLEKLTSQQWSPDQISCELEALSLPRISYETIYLRVYADKKSGGELHTHLRHKIKSYRNRSLTQDNRGRIKGATSIEDRPSVVEERSRLGDWEMDLIIGRASGSVLLTMVDSKSRYTIIEKVSNKTADAVAMAIMVRLLPHRSKSHTLTFDNGKEFAAHAMIDKILDSSSYFAHPYSSWERASRA